MDRRYEAYCLADPLFYDHPAAGEALIPGFAHTLRPAPPGWRAGRTGDWWRLLPAGAGLPDQGWKIHVSATPASAPGVLDVLWEQCVAAGLAFKFLRTPGLLFLRNSKYADRGSSGKFAAVYPADEAELEHALALLDRHLTGRPGPYILSDLRYRGGPLYVRYGGFAPRRCVDEATGESVPALTDPAGRLVPDVRGPVFAPPPWAALPGFMAPDLEARRSATIGKLPYRIERALHFSNGGGVYQGTDIRTGISVVLKEARPHAGLLGDGRDALTRLAHERDMLRRAAGSGAGPRVLDWVEAGEHSFLVLEHIPGRTLNSLFSERFPLIGRDPAPADLDAYTDWALGVCDRVEQLVKALHAHGVVFGDLHLFNIMVRPDDTVALIDFEVAAPLGEPARRLLAARAFEPPRELSGADVDRYALACLRLALFLPLTALLPLDRSRAGAMARAIRAEFPKVPAAFLDEALATIARAEAPGGPWSPSAPGAPGASAAAAARNAENPAARASHHHPHHDPAAGEADGVDAPLLDAHWPRLRTALAEGITAAANPERTDRLFPGDIRQFANPGAGLALAHGAAGVLYALHTAGVPVPDAYEHWLLTRADELPGDTRLGLYDGIHGIAHVLDTLGHPEPARRLLEAALSERWQRLGPDLHHGLAGIGLNLLHFAERTGETQLRDAAFEAGSLLARQLARRDNDTETAGSAAPGPGDGRTAGAGTRAGLMRGASGPALLFLHLYEHSGDDDWLARARAALRLDLSACVASPRDGSLRVSEGWRTMPYLAEGSAGIALVAHRYLAHREDAALRQATAAITLACTSRFYAQAGLFAGRAGLLLTLADAALFEAPGPASDGASPQSSPHAASSPWAPGAARGGPDALAQVRRLAWHAVGYRGTLAFPGDQLHRLSTDLATGSAGVLLALGAVFARHPAHLPFLTPPASGATGSHPLPAPPRAHRAVRAAAR